MLKQNLLAKIILLGIVLLGGFLRFYDFDWDQGQHLHPDERFLTMVGTSMIMPISFADYMNPDTSTFNPANIGHSFYVYGTLPVVLTKLIAINLGYDNYGDITILGRLFSGFVDILTIIVIYKITSLLQKRHKLHPHIKYWASFFYAITVLPIQLSHYFAVDTFLNFFMITAFYLMLRFSYTKNLAFVAVSAIFFGLAIGSKISAIYIAPLLAFFLVKTYIPHFPVHKKAIIHILLSGFIFSFTAYLIGRLADPYLFQTGNIFDPTISKLFLDNIDALKNWGSADAWFPPSVQWINKIPIVYPLINLVLLGIGVGYTIFLIWGAIQLFRRYTHIDFIAIFSWTLFFFLYQGLQFSTTMRYFLPLYPFLALLAAIGFYELTKHRSNVIRFMCIISVVLWTMFFFSIYTLPHTRNTASIWIYDHIPNGRTLLSEHWDDSLPLGTNPPSQKTYTLEQLPVFDPDTSEKWQKMDELLDRGDYLILSSNRGWGSIPTVPDRYPQTTKYYKDLLGGNSKYKKVAEFTSYPSLNYLGIPISIPDDWAEEAFTVYDHPKVMIFENTEK